MQCGEKDPFVDDTVIFAGRVREAKRARKMELDIAISGKSARFGEGLRMTDAKASGSSDALAAMRKERDQLALESEDDWVQMVLFSDWSHGYLQMPTLMTEAKAVINELGEWIDEAFGRYTREGSGNGDATASEMLTGKKTNSPPYGPQAGSGSPSPFNSPVPYDSDDPASSPEVGARSVVSSSGGSESTLLDNDRHVREGFKLSVDVLGPPDEELSDHTTRVGTPTKLVTPGKTGQTITETELMRRRRLLDSHIFD